MKCQILFPGEKNKKCLLKILPRVLSVKASVTENTFGLIPNIAVFEIWCFMSTLAFNFL